MIAQIRKLEKIIGMSVPLDKVLLMVGIVAIDIVEFDNKLMKRYNYTGSLKEFISEHFGKTAVDIIEKSINQINNYEQTN